MLEGLVMKKIALLALVVLLTGCTVHGGGSQALSFNPLNIGSDQPAVRVADDRQFSNGEPWDLRR